MNSVNAVNVSELQSLYSSDPGAKALIDLYATRERGRQDSTPPRMRRVLKSTGTDLSTTQVAEIMRKLQRIGLGRCVAGRHGRVSRFIWGFHLKSVADVARGNPGGLKPAPMSRMRLPKLQPLTVPTPKPVSMAPQAKPDTRQVIVRKAGFEIVLPLDMSQEDWKEAAVFLNNLNSTG